VLGGFSDERHKLDHLLMLGLIRGVLGAKESPTCAK
jgi:hypothetical protein